jgi:arylsulfatase A-like enzyme
VKAWESLSKDERAKAARDMEAYAAMVDFRDDQIKRVLDHLRKFGEYDDTLILFFSDNGANGAVKTAYFGQTPEYLATLDNSLENRGLPGSFVEMGPGWAKASMAPGRMFKAFPAEGGIRSPLLVKLPGKMANAGTRNHSFLHVRDVMPTILDSAGIEAAVRRSPGSRHAGHIGPGFTRRQGGRAACNGRPGRL